jgi:hypothetical protein
MPPEINDIDQWLQKIGISRKAWKKIRFGGVVGKLALVAVIVPICLAIVARQTTDASTLRTVAYLMVGVSLLAILAMWIYGHLHPLEATLEGTEIVAWQHVQHQYAQKGLPEVQESPMVLEGVGERPRDEIAQAVAVDHQEMGRPKGDGK